MSGPRRAAIHAGLRRWRVAVLTALTLAVFPACGERAQPFQAASCTPPVRPSGTFTPPPGSLGCPSTSELDEIDSQVRITFEGDSATGRSVCGESEGSRTLTQQQKDVYNSLIYLRRLEFDAPLPWTAASTFEWLRGTIRGIRVRTDRAGSWCCDPPQTINIGVFDQPESAIPAYAIAMVHEARHVQTGGHKCPDGKNDRTISEMGAYGVQYYLLVWIAAHRPATTPAEREYAVSFSQWLRAVAFCAECG
jgi:hypothetical protein